MAATVMAKWMEGSVVIDGYVMKEALAREIRPEEKVEYTGDGR